MALAIGYNSILANPCLYAFHQSYALDQKIYIDGGISTDSSGGAINLDAGTTTVSYRVLRIIDLGNVTSISINGTNQPRAHVDKYERPDSISNNAFGALWMDAAHQKLYRYGGAVADQGNDLTLVSGPSYRSAVLVMDLQKGLSSPEAWYPAPNSTDPALNRMGFGASARSRGTDKGFWVGGIDANIGVDTTSLQTVQQGIRPYLISWNATTNTFYNNTIATKKDPTVKLNPGNQGVLIHVPLGEQGLLVSMGGIQYQTVDAPTLPMNVVRVYDIESDSWFNQTTKGDVPLDRNQFCGALGMPSDKSSFNIYVVGGVTGKGKGADDVYILSLPAFEWTRAYYGSAMPRRGQSCEVIRNGQLAVIGGLNSTADPVQCYNDTGSDLRIFNMGTLNYTAYNPSITTYTVPRPIVSLVGGTERGGATLLDPKHGYDDLRLGDIFKKLRTQASEPSAISPDGNGTKLPPVQASAKGLDPTTRTGIIAGSVVGGIAIVVFALTIFIFCRRRKHHQQKPSRSNEKRPFNFLASPSPTSDDNDSDKPLPPSPLRVRSTREPVQLPSHYSWQRSRPTDQQLIRNTADDSAGPSSTNSPNSAYDTNPSAPSAYGTTPTLTNHTLSPVSPLNDADGSATTYTSLRDRIQYLEDPHGVLRPAPLRTSQRGARRAAGGASPIARSGAVPGGLSIGGVLHEMPERGSWLDDAMPELEGDGAVLELEGEGGMPKFDAQQLYHPLERRERSSIAKDFPIQYPGI